MLEDVEAPYCILPANCQDAFAHGDKFAVVAVYNAERVRDFQLVTEVGSRRRIFAFARNDCVYEIAAVHLSSSKDMPLKELQELLDPRQPEVESANQGRINYLCGNFNENLWREISLVE